MANRNDRIIRGIRAPMREQTLLGRLSSGDGPVEMVGLNELTTFLGIDVQQILDSGIGTTQGTIIYRNANDWVGLAPGTAGQILQTGGAGADPSWVGGSSGAAGLTWTWPATVTAAVTPSGNTACKGVTVKPLTDIAVKYVGAKLTTVAGGTYYSSIYDINSSGVIQSIVGNSTSIVAAGNVTGGTLLFTYDPALTLVAGTLYTVTIRRSDGGDSYLLPVFSSTTTAFYDLPLSEGGSAISQLTTLAKASPAVSDTFSFGSGSRALGIGAAF